MNARLVVILAALVVVVASAASATSLTCNISTVGDLTTYTYTLTSGEAGDYITQVHLFAMLDLSLIAENSGPSNWQFDAFVDPDPEVGADIYWYASDYDLHGIPNGAVKQFSLTVPSWTTTDTNHVIPGCFGNWGYECYSWQGAVIVSYPSIAVPSGSAAPAVPEPGSLSVLAFGLTLIAHKLRRKA